MRGAIMAKVPEAALEILAGEDALTLYEWNSRVAKHYFCSRCGIYVFHRKRAAPEHYGVNARCLEGLDLGSLPLRATEGANMTLVDPEARLAWPGPRISSRSGAVPQPDRPITAHLPRPGAIRAGSGARQFPRTRASGKRRRGH